MSKLIYLNLSACHICCIYGQRCSVAPFNDNFYPSNPSFPLLTLRCSVALFNDNFYPMAEVDADIHDVSAAASALQQCNDTPIKIAIRGAVYNIR